MLKIGLEIAFRSSLKGLCSVLKSDAVKAAGKSYAYALATRKGMDPCLFDMYKDVVQIFSKEGIRYLYNLGKTWCAIV
mgnify:CR=1 FL=1